MRRGVLVSRELTYAQKLSVEYVHVTSGSSIVTNVIARRITLAVHALGYITSACDLRRRGRCLQNPGAEDGH